MDRRKIYDFIPISYELRVRKIYCEVLFFSFCCFSLFILALDITGSNIIIIMHVLYTRSVHWSLDSFQLSVVESKLKYIVTINNQKMSTLLTM